MPARTDRPSRATGRAAPLPLDLRLTRRLADALLVLAGGALLAMLLGVAAQQPRFRIRVVTLEGDLSHVSPALIRSQVLPRLSGNYFTLNLREARRTFETVPWVRRATVRRIWPDRLVVSLEQHQAAAYWERDDGDHLLVNRFGEVFEANLGDVEDDDLPTLRGPDGSAAAVWTMYRRLAPPLAGLGDALDILRLSPRGSWQATLASGARLELGRGSDDEVVQRTGRFVATIGQVTTRMAGAARGAGGIEYADLRHADAYALRLHGIGTARDGAPAAGARAARR